ncbi:cupin domain-containing protein [Mesorhizobium delmotii]
MHARSSNSADPVVHLLRQFLDDLRPAEASYCRAEVTRPWGIGLQFQRGIRFHFVAEGTCWVLVEGSEPERLDKGDVVLLPHGTKHVIADDPDGAVTDLALLPKPLSAVPSSGPQETLPDKLGAYERFRSGREPEPKCADARDCIKGNRLLGRVRRPLAFALLYRLSPTAAQPQGGCGRQATRVGFHH